MWSKARLTVYLTSAILGLGSLASLAGLATYDAATGMIDPHPFSLYFVAGVVVPPVASALAAVANMLGWKAK